jgi:hypothetical protein
MKRGRGQLRGTISTMPCQIHVANLGGKGDLGRLVAIPASVVRPAGQGAEAAMSSGGRITNSHEVALR